MNKVVELGKLLKDSWVTDGIKSLAEIQGNNSNIGVGSKEHLLTYLWWPMLLSPDFTIYTGDQGQKMPKIIAASGHREVKIVQKSICAGLGPGLHWGSLQCSPDPIASGERARSPSQRTPPRLGLCVISCLFVGFERTVCTLALYVIKQ